MKNNRRRHLQRQKRKTAPPVFHVKESGKQQNSSVSGAVPKVVDTAKPQTQVQVNSRMVWMLGDRHNVRRQQFADAGWTIGYSKQCALTNSQQVNLRKRLASEQPLLLYIVNFGNMPSTKEVSSFLRTFISEQLNLCGLVMVQAPEQSSAWKMGHNKSEDYESYVSFCLFF